MSEWVDGLERTAVLDLWTAITRRDLWRYQELLALIGGMATSFAAANIMASVFPSTPVPVMISVVASAALAGHSLFNLLLEYSFERIGVSWHFPYIILNKGDERNYAKFIQRRTRAGRIGWLILGSGFVWIVGNVLSKIILHRLGY